MIKMIKSKYINNCAGCDQNFNEVCDYVIEKGYHIATTTELSFCEDKHINVLLVDDKGTIKVHQFLDWLEK